MKILMPVFWLEHSLAGLIIWKNRDGIAGTGNVWIPVKKFD